MSYVADPWDSALPTIDVIAGYMHLELQELKDRLNVQVGTDKTELNAINRIKALETWEGTTNTWMSNTDDHQQTQDNKISTLEGIADNLDNDYLGINSNAVSASRWANSRTLTLGGDLSGQVTFNGSQNFTLTATVKDDSHNHTIANVDGLQNALDGKLATSGTAANSQKLDNLDSTQFLRSDAADIKNSGSLTFNDNVYMCLGTGKDVEHYWNGSHYYTDINGGANWLIRDGNSSNATRFTFDIDNGYLTLNRLYATRMYADEVYDDNDRVFSPNNRNISTSVSSSSTTVYASASAVKSAYDRATGARGAPDLATNRKRLITTSASAPSGGSDGDIWMVYE